MTEVNMWLEPYQASILIIGLTGALSLLQLILFDFMAIKLKHQPGHPVENDHRSLLFRLSRAHANTNETMGVLILLFLFVLFTAANPLWVNGLMMAYFVSRVLHMIFYYAGWSFMRGLVFGGSLLSMIGLFVFGLIAWLS